MKKYIFIILTLLASTGFGQVIRPFINAGTLLTRDTSAHNYSIATRYWSSVTFAPITGSAVYSPIANPVFTGTATIPTLKLTPSASAPSTAEEGMIYANTNHTLNYFNGTSWINLSAASNTNFQGIAWDEATDTYTRTGTLTGKTLGTSPGNLYLPVQSNMKGCLLQDNGTVNYYLSATDWAYKESGAASTLTGADGQVMVQIPKFYYQYQRNGTVSIWNISTDSLPGYTRHPAFIKDGVYKDYRYIGAYEGVLWDATTDSAYRDYKAGVTITPANDKLSSVSGFRPVTNFTRANGRLMASNRGAGWRQMDYDLVNAIQILFLVEYGTFNSQSVMSGITNVGDWAAYNNYYPIVATGMGNSIGNATGQNAAAANASSATVAASGYSKYRGISNFYGHIYKWVDGINVNNNHPYVSNNSSVWADNTSTGYVDPGVTLSASDGYQKTLVNSSRLILPASVGGSSSTYIPDYYYQAAGWRVALFGGTAHDGGYAGAWYWYFRNSDGGLYQYFGSRISY